MKISEKYKKLSLIGLLLLILAFGVSSFGGNYVFADNDDEDRKDKTEKRIEKLKGINPEVSINANGNVTVRGAKVTSIIGNSINVEVTFGAFNMNWAVLTSTSTKIIRNNGNASVFGDINVGDVINFSGKLDPGQASPTVNASLIRDTSLTQIITRHVFEGKLVSLTGSTTPTTAFLKIGNIDFTVNIPTGISILNKNWQLTSLSLFQPGHHIRVYGYIPPNATSSISASVIRNIDI